MADWGKIEQPQKIKVQDTLKYHMIHNSIIMGARSLEKIKILFFSSIIALSAASCWRDKSFYIEDPEIFVDIEETGYYSFRIFLYKDAKDRGKDYIDIDYDMSEMPSIQLCFPYDGDNRIYIIDSRHDVEDVKSSNFVFTCLSKEQVTNGELPTQKQMDSINKNIQLSDSIRENSITVQLNSGLIDLSVWKNKKYQGKVRNQNHIN